MDALLISAASGMKSRLESLDLLANNIANSGTAGYKADREFYGLYDDHLPVLEHQWTDFSQAALVQTGNPLSLALAGEGYFALNSPSGIVYTRSGTFQISKANELAAADGNTLRNVLDQGRPIKVDPEQPIDIGKDGIVRQSGPELGQIEVARIASAPVALTKLGNSYFALMDKSGAAPKDPKTDVMQGHLEQSNVPVAEGAVQLISVMRQYEMLQKAMRLGADMNKLTLEQVAKV